jgi:integrase
MTKRRSRGDGGLYWSESRQRWIAEVTIGYDGRGKRITRKASDRNKTRAKDKLREIQRDFDDGLAAGLLNYTVGDAVRDWLEYGLSSRDQATVTKLTSIANTHVIPVIGARKLRELSADDVDRWLAAEAEKVSTRTLQDVRSILRRTVSRAQARDKVKRNVAMLCELPKGRSGRPSKSLTREQAALLLDYISTPDTPVTWIGVYVVLSLLTGARTEELRELRWDHVVAYAEAKQNWRPVTEVGWEHQRFAIYVWRSVRATGDTRTRKSRRTIALPRRCAWALGAWQVQQASELPPGVRRSIVLVFTTAAGARLDKDAVLRAFRKVLAAAGLDPEGWTPRELRHTFVSVLSDDGMPIEQISQLAGHSETATTESVYRHQIRPVVLRGAEAMDRIFPMNQEPSDLGKSDTAD